MEELQNTNVEETEKEQKASKVTFSEEQQEHINKLISQQRSKAVEEFQKKQSEAEKLAKMSDNDKNKYELDKITKENQELADKVARFEMEKVATKILNDSDIPISDEVLELVIKGDAETTKSAINALVGLVNTFADRKVDSMLIGKSPKRVENTGNVLTKQQIMAIPDRTKRQELIEQNIDLFR